MKLSSVYRIEAADKADIENFFLQYWGSGLIITRGRKYTPADVCGFKMVEEGKTIGLISYAINGDECEIVSLNSVSESKGVGSALLEKVIQTASDAKLKRVYLITTNDNCKALRFYQKRGFGIKAVYLYAVRRSRKLKPEIPLIGFNNIPVEHEIELEYLTE